MISNSPKIFKLSFAIFITLLSFLTICLGTWKSPDVNHSGETNIHTCIHSDDRKLRVTLDASNCRLDVDFTGLL